MRRSLAAPAGFTRPCVAIDDNRRYAPKFYRDFLQANLAESLEDEPMAQAASTAPTGPSGDGNGHAAGGGAEAAVASSDAQDELDMVA